MSELQSLLQKHGLPKAARTGALSALSTRLQDAKPHEIVFYRLRDAELFHQRRSAGNPGLVITTGGAPPPGVLGLSSPAFFSLQQELADFLHPLPPAPLIGVTGTNGKTSTAWLVGQILKQHRLRGLVVGTLGLFDHDRKREDWQATTPGFVDFAPDPPPAPRRLCRFGGLQPRPRPAAAALPPPGLRRLDQFHPGPHGLPPLHGKLLPGQIENQRRPQKGSPPFFIAPSPGRPGPAFGKGGRFPPSIEGV